MYKVEDRLNALVETVGEASVRARDGTPTAFQQGEHQALNVWKDAQEAVDGELLPCVLGCCCCVHWVVVAVYTELLLCVLS
jgi:hypothetical protein